MQLYVTSQIDGGRIRSSMVKKKLESDTCRVDKA